MRCRTIGTVTITSSVSQTWLATLKSTLVATRRPPVMGTLTPSSLLYCGVRRGTVSVLIEEARWLGDQLSALDPDRVFPLLDVGSSTLSFRTREQPRIDELIFAPARADGRTVLHLDAKSDEGVDIVTDLSDR